MGTDSFLTAPARLPVLAAALLFAQLAAPAAEPLPPPELSPAPAVAAAKEYPLDIAADFSPVLCGGDLFLFSSSGGNQTLRPGDPAPNCNVTAIHPAFQPVCSSGAVWALDTSGALWRVAAERASVEAEGLEGAVALAPGEPSPALLFSEELRLPSGKRLSLPFKAIGMSALEGGGFWVFGEGAGALVSKEGSLLWTVRPKGLRPGPAALSGARLFCGTKEGALLALESASGKEKFRYRTGGAIVSPPVAAGDIVAFASRDHHLRGVFARTGLLAWQTRLDGRPDFGPLASTSGLLVAEASGTRLLLFSARDGRRLWSWTLPGGSIESAPAAASGEAALTAWGEGETPTLFRIALPKTEGGRT